MDFDTFMYMKEDELTRSEMLFFFFFKCLCSFLSLHGKIVSFGGREGDLFPEKMKIELHYFTCYLKENFNNPLLSISSVSSKYYFFSFSLVLLKEIVCICTVSCLYIFFLSEAECQCHQIVFKWNASQSPQEKK